MVNYSSTPYSECQRGRTLSGHDAEGELCPYIDMYLAVFLTELEDHGIDNDERLTKKLTEMEGIECVGDFLETPSKQAVQLATFGLILLNRLGATKWGKQDPLEAFVIHEQIFECFEYLQDKNKRSAEAKRRVSLRFEKNRVAEAMVVSHWFMHRLAYENNKTMFARTYVKLVFNEHGVVVTEKQMREVWLKDTPSTGKPARLPVDGE